MQLLHHEIHRRLAHPLFVLVDAAATHRIRREVQVRKTHPTRSARPRDSIGPTSGSVVITTSGRSRFTPASNARRSIFSANSSG